MIKGLSVETGVQICCLKAWYIYSTQHNADLNPIEQLNQKMITYPDPYNAKKKCYLTHSEGWQPGTYFIIITGVGKDKEVRNYQGKLVWFIIIVLLSYYYFCNI